MEILKKRSLCGQIFEIQKIFDDVTLRTLSYSNNNIKSAIVATKMAIREKELSTENTANLHLENNAESERSFIGALLLLDLHLSSLITIEGRPKTTMIKMSRLILKFLEVTGHGVPWLLISAFYGYRSSGNFQEFNINLLVALLLDLVVVGTLKVLTGRKRPSHNKDDMFATVSVDKYSFPSGHATRVSMVAVLFSLSEMDPTYLLFVKIWAVVVSVSRIILGRHHILDVVAGVLIGVFDAWIVIKYCWMDAHTVKDLISNMDKFIFT